MDEFEKIIASDLPDLEKLAKAYQWTVKQYISASRFQLELLRAMEDREQLVKEQVKLGVMESAWEMFENCFLKVTGKKVSRYEPKI